MEAVVERAEAARERLLAAHGSEAVSERCGTPVKVGVLPPAGGAMPGNVGRLFPGDHDLRPSLLVSIFSTVGVSGGESGVFGALELPDEPDVVERWADEVVDFLVEMFRERILPNVEAPA